MFTQVSFVYSNSTWIDLLSRKSQAKFIRVLLKYQFKGTHWMHLAIVSRYLQISLETYRDSSHMATGKRAKSYHMLWSPSHIFSLLYSRSFTSKVSMAIVLILSRAPAIYETIFYINIYFTKKILKHIWTAWRNSKPSELYILP